MVLVTNLVLAAEVWHIGCGVRIFMNQLVDQSSIRPVGHFSWLEPLLYVTVTGLSGDRKVNSPV